MQHHRADMTLALVAPAMKALTYAAPMGIQDLFSLNVTQETSTSNNILSEICFYIVQENSDTFGVNCIL